MQWTVKAVLDWVSLKFSNEGMTTPRLDAQLIICHVLGLEKVELYTDPKRPLTDEEREDLREMVKRRLKREPIAYILNKKYWYSFELYVDKRVLIPRPETETLLDFVIKQFPKQEKKSLSILDLCTGSGCFALALAENFPNSRVVAVDNSNDALSVAKINLKKYGLNERVQLLEKDVTNESTYSFLKEEFSSFDIIVSNPPYVSESEYKCLEEDIRSFEPKVALVASDDGLSISKRLWQIVQEFSLIKENSLFIMELGDKQAQKLHSGDLSSHPYSLRVGSYPKNKVFVLKDLEEKDRFLVKFSL